MNGKYTKYLPHYIMFNLFWIFWVFIVLGTDNCGGVRGQFIAFLVPQIVVAGWIILFILMDPNIEQKYKNIIILSIPTFLFLIVMYNVLSNGQDEYYKSMMNSVMNDNSTMNPGGRGFILLIGSLLGAKWFYWFIITFAIVIYIKIIYGIIIKTTNKINKK